MEIKHVIFADRDDFRKWLEENHQTKSELIVGYYKVGTKKPCMTYPQSVEEALCFGWIDGITRSLDGERYCVRFTPRKPRSNWSAVNIARVEELIRLGKMTPAGMAAFEKRAEARSGIYSYENQPEKLSDELEARFKQNLAAWDFFHSQPPSYRKMMVYWVMSAKQEATRFSRLEKLMAASAGGKRMS
jgi:uncharacterized protein YdeI (YjbR/CyaY-like superfamily)